MKLLISLLSISIIVAQKHVDLGAKASHSKEIQFKKLAKLVDEEEGFYDESKTTVAPNGTIFLLDFGNKVVHRYSKDGKHEAVFGKEGNGPGEINQFTLSIYASNDRLLLGKGQQVMMIFDYDGKLINEITKTFISRTLPQFDGDKIHFHFAPTNLSKERKLTYTKDGKFIKEEANNIYDESAINMFRQGMSDERIKKTLEMPNSLDLYKNGFIVGYGGDYKLQYIDKNQTLKKTFSRSYKRIKVVDIMDIVPRFMKRFLKNMKDENQRKGFMQITHRFKDQMNGYFPDVMRIIGVYKDYVFVRTSSDVKNQLRLDVISPDDKLYAVKEIDSKDEYISSSVVNGKLVINYTSEDDGPYAMVYDIALNE